MTLRLIRLAKFNCQPPSKKSGVYIFLLLMIGINSCSSPPETMDSLNSAEPHFNTTLSNKQIMSLILEPASDILWDSGGWVLDSAGYEELFPTTDDGWDYVRAQAAIVVETGNLLALPERAPDNDAWLIYSNGLSDAGLLAMDAAESRNEEAFFEAGGQIYSVCTACHQAYNPEIVNRFDSAD